MLFTDFTCQYPLSKTLRFELKPIGKTLAHIHAKNFLQKDATLADSYQKIKPILDEYHRDFIELALQDIELMELENFHTHYLALKQNKNNNNAKKSLQDLQKKLCEAIANKLEKAQKDNSLFSKLHSADLFNEDILKKWVEDIKTQHLDKISDIERFKRFAGYFNGFQTSRKNFYSKEAKKGSIAYRIVYENLPRFCNNMDVLKVITQNHPELYIAIQKILSDVDLLDINCYNKCLSQSGIDKYNRMIGEINKKSNEYNQQNKLTGRNKIANLRKLYKQILSLPEVDLSFLPEALKNDKELVVALNGLYLGMDNQSIYTELKQLICEIENAYNLDKIYINPKKIGYLSKCAYDNWHLLRTLLEKDFQQNNLQGKKEEDEKYYKRQIEHVESYHSIAYLNSLVKKYNQDVEDKLSENAIISTLMSFKKLVIDKNKSDDEKESMECIIKDIDEKYKTIKGLLNDDYEDDSKRLCSKNKDNVDNNIYNIRLFLDAIDDFWKFSKILYIKNQSSDMEIDTDFYAKFEELYKSLSIYISTYNKARNYLTQKVDNTQKYKLNFDNAYLLDGWDLNKEKDNFGIILQKNGNYYLAILDEEHGIEIEKDKSGKNGEKLIFPPAVTRDVYKKMNYKYLDVNKQFPKVFFSDDARRINYNASQDIRDKRSNLRNCSEDEKKYLYEFVIENLQKHPKYKSEFQNQLNGINFYKTDGKGKQKLISIKELEKLINDIFKVKPKIEFNDFFIYKERLYYPSSSLLDQYDEYKSIGDNASQKKINDFHNKYPNYKKDLVNYYYDCLEKHPEWENIYRFKENLKPIDDYQDTEQMFVDIKQNKLNYKVSFMDIDSKYIDNLVEQGKLYLFQIYNKDFPRAYLKYQLVNESGAYILKAYSQDFIKKFGARPKTFQGNPKLHTMYFKALFSDENLNNVVYKLNGEAEIFYRPASLNKNDVAKHPKGDVLEMKNPNHEKYGLSKDDPNNKIATYTIYKDKRYTQDKFLLHIPITMNFGASDVGFKAFNQKVNQTLKNSQDDIHIIGIDRGERHLLYVSVINQKGEIIEQKSLNEIVNTGHNGIELAVNYHTLLDNKEKERLEARVNWGEIENIKEIKQGYLSQVVHYISQLMLEHNAIVVLEDLNFGFKRGRFKVEKQVYQNFENALIKKLNYLVLKNKASNELGGVRNALQLTNKFEDIDIKNLKQAGFLFYVNPQYTSKIDPTTGFINLLPLNYENLETAKAFFNKFDSICYNTERDYFEFTFDYKNFGNKATGLKTDWIACSSNNVRHPYYSKSNKQDKKDAINVNQELKYLFNECGIDYQTGNNLVDDICQNNTKKLYSGLYYLLKVLLQMRYYYKEKDKNGNVIKEWDFILSPVQNNQGDFFDSRKIEELPKKERKLPENSDANGAYHIALKGLWVLQQIKESGNLKYIKNEDWLEFTQSRCQ